MVPHDTSHLAPFRPDGVDAGTSSGKGLAVAADDRVEVFESLHFLQVYSADADGSVSLGAAHHVHHLLGAQVQAFLLKPGFFFEYHVLLIGQEDVVSEQE